MAKSFINDNMSFKLLKSRGNPFGGSGYEVNSSIDIQLKLHKEKT